jgi:hypothetical protein
MARRRRFFRRDADSGPELSSDAQSKEFWAAWRPGEEPAAEGPPEEDPADEGDAAGPDEEPPEEESAGEDAAAMGQAGPGADEVEGPERATDESSGVDAMGQDKRRQVVGHTYAPTRTRIAVRFVIFLAVMALLLVGAKIAVDRLDQPPDTVSTEAPWAQPDAEQRPPKPVQ